MTLPANIIDRRWFGVVLVVVLALVTFSPILRSPFKVVYDRTAVVENPLIRAADPAAIFTSSLFQPSQPYRPLTVAGHALEYRLAGWTPVVFFLTNLFVHILNALLIYALTARLLQDRAVALAVAVLFCVHPAQWPAVSLLSGRPELFNALFNLLAVACCGAYLRRLNGWWLAASLFCFACALLSRESREYFCALMIVYLWTSTVEGDGQGLRRLIVLPYAALTLIYAGVRHGVAGLSWPGPVDDLPARVLDASGAFWARTIELVVPGAHLQSAFGSASPQAILLTVGVGLFVLGCLWINRRHLSAPLAFLAGWYVVALWPLIASADHAGALEAADVTYTYLAVAPLAAIIALGFRRLLVSVPPNQRPGTRKFVIATAVCVSAFFVVLTYRYASYSTDEMASLTAQLRQAPDDAGREYSLGLLYEGRHQMAEAQAHWRAACALNPDFIEAHLALGESYAKEGRWLEAVKAYEAIRNPGGFQETVEDRRRAAYKVLALNQEAELAKKPGDPTAYFSLGLYYARLGDKGQAINAYQNVIDLDSENAAGLRNMALKFQGMLFEEIGQTTKARENFERAGAR